MKQAIKLNLGSGNTKLKGYLNVDICPTKNTDVVADLNKTFPFKDNSVEEIRCDDLLEHVKEPISFLKECNRILVMGGTMQIHVPHYKDSGAYRPQHKTYFSYSWFSRGLKEKFIDVGDWEIVYLKLSYKKGLITPLDYLANLFPKVWERLFWVVGIEIKLKKSERDEQK